MDELEGRELEATRLEPADDATDKPALDAVGLLCKRVSTTNKNVRGKLRTLTMM